MSMIDRILESLPDGAAAAQRASLASQAAQQAFGRIEGFGPMARIMTNFGEVHAHVLRKGDMVRTADGTYKCIETIDRIKLDEDFLQRYPTALPIRVRKNALGQGLPKVDMIVAPYQSLHVGPSHAADAQVKAAELLARPFVDRVRELQITYTTFSVGEPARVYCEGVAVDIPA